MFEPSAVAVVGASKVEGKIGYEAMANAALFDGPVYPVNPSASGELFGSEFVSSVTDIDDDVDLALCCVPGPAVPDVLEECGEAGVGAVVLYSSGFAEAGDEGEELQETIVGIADEHGISLLGPNTSGFLVPARNLRCSFASGVEEIPPGNTAILAQSGGVAHTLAYQSRRQGRGISAMVGLGNRANVGFAETIEYFDADENTDAIVLHVEGTDDGRGLLEACRASDTPDTLPSDRMGVAFAPSASPDDGLDRSGEGGAAPGRRVGGGRRVRDGSRHPLRLYHSGAES